jgi:hypothetical protein
VDMGAAGKGGRGEGSGHDVRGRRVMHLVPARPKVYVVVWTTAVFTIPEQTSAYLLEDTCAWAREGQHLIRSFIQSSFRRPLSLPPSATSHALLPVPAVVEELDQYRRHQ